MATRAIFITVNGKGHDVPAAESGPTSLDFAGIVALSGVAGATTVKAHNLAVGACCSAVVAGSSVQIQPGSSFDVATA